MDEKFKLLISISVALIVSLSYFGVMMYIGYYGEGIVGNLSYLLGAILLFSIYWGFQSPDRVRNSILLISMVILNFFLDGYYTFWLFVGLLFLFYNTRDFWFFSLLFLIGVNGYTLYNPTVMTTTVPLSSRISDIKGFVSSPVIVDNNVSDDNTSKVILPKSFYYERIKNPRY